MYKKTKTILDQICANKEIEIATDKQQTSLDEILVMLKQVSDSKNFAQAISHNQQIHLIAEIKQASPRGVIREQIDVAQITRDYSEHGASAISVLTETKYFLGSKQNLIIARKNTKLPILRKDFIIDPYQIYQSKLLGADAILLIVKLLDLDSLKNFYTIASSVNLDVIFEISNQKELRTALELKPKIIGINNRDLANFTINKDNFPKLRKYIPSDIIVVAESGIETREDVQYFTNQGANAVLVGSSLMKEKDIPAKLKYLLGK